VAQHDSGGYQRSTATLWRSEIAMGHGAAQRSLGIRHDDDGGDDDDDQGRTGRAAWLPGTCQVGRLVRRPGVPPRQMLK